MLTKDPKNPFHDGELQAQASAGVGDVAKWAGGFIRDYLPEQHRAFHTSLPFLVVCGSDADGHVWVTLMEGPEGFATSPDPRQIALATELEKSDPLANSFGLGADIGVLGIELHTRRRNRFSGRISRRDAGCTIDIRQTFGNCPQYIHEREWVRAPQGANVQAKRSRLLSPDQIARITSADTMFIGSGHMGAPGAASNGYDASHRGGAAGFVKVVDQTRLQIPDYAGNNFFNTIGNIVSNPRVGLLFVDFETGGLLHITGRASINWTPRDTQDPGAQRIIDVEIDAVIERLQAVGLRWANKDRQSRQLRLAQRVKESAGITSFYFEAADGRALEPFEAGQHLPIKLQIPGRSDATTRSYSLSGPPTEAKHYRLSIKREDHGLVSRHFHDKMTVGSLIETGAPSGDFVVPCSRCPLVLASAGVGLTPMVAMLHAVAHQDRPVWYVHGARNGQDHAMRDEVGHLVGANKYVNQRIFYSQPDQSDVLGKDYDAKGRLTAEDLLSLNAGPEAHYMLCGPAAFLAEIRIGLEAGVPNDRIHFETFGPVGPSA